MTKARVILVDDHALVRSGIRLVLQTLKGIEVVDEARDGRQALTCIEKLRPDVALVDISMPGLNGIETTSQIKNRFPKTRVIMLSMHEGEHYVLQALRAGADGYMLKDASPTELQFALSSVMKGETYLCPRVSNAVVFELLRSENNSMEPLDKLTSRQREILQLIAEGSSTKEMAAELGVSVKTIETHRAQMMVRLKIHDVAGLVRFAIRNGIVQEE